MSTVQTVENILIVIVFIFLALYGFASLAETKPHWFQSKVFLKCRKIQQKYQRLVQARRDMLHHYYRNKSENKKSETKKQEKQIIRIDRQLQETRAQYEMVRKGLPVPLKMF